MRTTYISAVLAVIISALGVAALPHAEQSEQVFNTAWAPTGWLGLVLPHALGLVLAVLAWAALARLDWARFRTDNLGDWLVATVLVTMLPLAWRDISDNRLIYFGVDSLIVTMPFLVFSVAALNQLWASSGNQPGLRTVIGLALGMTALAIFASPFAPPMWLLLLPLVIALSAPSLRKAGLASLAMLMVLLGVAVFSAPYRLHRFVQSIFPDPWSEPLGSGYQLSHAYKLLFDAGWLGSQSTLHLPAAMSQYLPVSIAVQWGWLAFAGVFVLIAFWLVLTWPRTITQADRELQGVDNFLFVAARMIWFVLFFAVVDAGLVNTLLIQPHGAGMPLLTSNWGWMLLAGLLLGLNSQRKTGLAATPAMPETDHAPEFPEDWPRSCRLVNDTPTTVYFCWNCKKTLGLRKAVVFSDKTDRAYCSARCQSEARNHASWEYECRGGDY